MKLTLKRAISLLLVLIFVFQLLPASSFAVDPEETPQEAAEEEAAEEIADETAEQGESASEDSYVVGETEDHREESVKHYRLSDGSFLAVEYGYPIHYKDAEDNWVDIDNTLEKSGDDFVSVNGDMSKTFPDSLASGELFEMQYKDYGISMSLVAEEVEPSAPTEPEASSPAETSLPSESMEPDATAPTESMLPTETEAPETIAPDATPMVSEEPEATPEASEEPSETESPSSFDNTTQNVTAYSRVQNADVKAVVENPVSTEKVAGQSSREEMIALDKIDSTVRFDNALNNTDFVYENHGYDLKERIVIHERQTAYRYAFALELTGLTPVLQETGSILLNNSRNEPVFGIPAPYMYDADGAVSDQVKYSLVPSNDGYILTVSADAAWINAEDRAFPVTLDPTVSVHYDGTISTTYIRSNYGNTTGGNVEMYCGYNTSYGQCQIIVGFSSLPTIPENCVPTGAQLSLAQAAYYTSSTIGGSAPSGNIIVEAHAINGTISNIGNYTWNLLYPGGSTDNVDASVLDFQSIGSSTINHYCNWNISRAAIPWLYSSTANVGVVLTAPGAQQAERNSNFYGSGANECSPYLIVQYQNMVGLEDCYTYQEASAGRAGDVSIGDFTQKMTLEHPDVSLSLEPMDIVISHYYNSCLANYFFTTYTSSHPIDLHTKNYDTMKLGLGWKLSLQQTIVEKTIDSVQYLIYTDGDGTEHYLIKDGSQYKDEGGLGYTATITSNSPKIYTMTDKDEHHTWTFYNGYLLTFSDFNGNSITIAYNNTFASGNNWHPVSGQANRIKQVKQHTNPGTQDDIIVATFAYDGDYLSSITDYAGKVTGFSYTDANNNNTSRLRTITQPDGKQAKYAYRDAGEMIRAYDAESGNGLTFSYWGANTVGSGYLHTVNQVKEYYADSWEATRTYGNQMHFYQNSNQLTSMRFYGADHASDTDDDLVVYNAFDYYGRTITSYTLDSNKAKMLCASGGIYAPNSSENPEANNRLARTACSGQHTENLILNGGLESLSQSGGLLDWSKSRSTSVSSDADATSVVSCSNGGVSISPHTGGRMLSTFLGGALELGSGYSFLKQEVSLQVGETYTLSAYVNTATVSQFDPEHDTNGTFIAFMKGSTFCAKSEIIRYKTNPEISGGWERISVTYTPTEAATYYVMIGQRGVLGYSAFDDIQMELGDTMSKVNLLQNAGFEQHTSGGSATYWNTPGCYYQSNLGADRLPGGDTWMVRLVGSPTQNKSYSQSVNINLPWNTTFLLSGWGKAQSAFFEVKDSLSAYDRFFGLKAEIHYSSGSPDTIYVPFNPMYEGWQYASGVIAPKGQKADGTTITSITISYAYNKNVNTAYFDNLSLIQEPAQTYSYDSKGNPVAATEDEAKVDYTYYGDSSRLQSYTSPSGVIHTFTYFSNNESNNLESETVASLRTSYQYNDSGSVTVCKTKHLDEAYYLQSQKGYDPSQNHCISSTDVNGIESTYTYDATTHELTQSHTGGVIRATQSYTWDANNGRITKTSVQDVDDLNYGYYNRGRLSTMGRKSFTWFTNGTEFWQRYSMTYDDFGNNTTVRVTSKTNADDDYPTSKRLVGYIYESSVNDHAIQNGRLQQMKYPNGNTVDYGYDLFDRITTESYTNSNADDNKQHKYYYDAEGNLARQERVNNSGNVAETYIFDYDSLGRLIHSKKLDENKDFVLRTEHSYDAANRLTAQNWMASTGASYTQSYTYRDGEDENGNPVANPDGMLTKITAKFQVGNSSYSPNITFGYNKLRQVIRKTTGNNWFWRAYSYKNGAGTNQKTWLVDYMNYRYPNPDPDGDDFLILGYRYYYNDLGDISKICKSLDTGGADEDHPLQTYTYDKLGQLKTCVDSVAGVTYKYYYDTAGNLRNMKELVDEEETSSKWLYYNDDIWHDRLSSVKVGNTSETITYETATSGYISGNPISYYNGRHYDFTWKNGRQLATASVDNTTVTYDYDMSGVRSQKTVGNTLYTYDTLSGLVVHQHWNPDQDLYFIYDDNNQPYALFYKNSSGTVYRYYYLLNQQGDVVGLMNGSYSLIAEYRYDPWGAVKVYDANGTELSETDTNKIGIINPLRYRGYYYDKDTGLYYLQSRYYDPAIGRFINADTFTTTDADGFLSCNMFAYCENNPICRVDKPGHFWETAFDVISLGASIVEVAANPTNPWAWAGLIGDAIDLIPFVTGVGETTRVIKTTVEVVKKGEDIIDTANSVRKSNELLKGVTGSYEIMFKSGFNYVGKGGFNRAIVSAAEKASKYKDEVVSIMWKSAPNAKQAFIDEFFMQLKRGVLNADRGAKTYNKIWSPGKRIVEGVF